MARRSFALCFVSFSSFHLHRKSSYSDAFCAEVKGPIVEEVFSRGLTTPNFIPVVSPTRTTSLLTEPRHQLPKAYRQHRRSNPGDTHGSSKKRLSSKKHLVTCISSLLCLSAPLFPHRAVPFGFLYGRRQINTLALAESNTGGIGRRDNPGGDVALAAAHSTNNVGNAAAKMTSHGNKGWVGGCGWVIFCGISRRVVNERCNNVELRFCESQS